MTSNSTGFLWDVKMARRSATLLFDEMIRLICSLHFCTSFPLIPTITPCKVFTMGSDKKNRQNCPPASLVTLDGRRPEKDSLYSEAKKCVVKLLSTSIEERACSLGP